MLRAIYAIYDKNDNYIMQGNSKECAEYLGIKRSSFFQRLSGFKSGKFNGRFRGYIIRVE